MTTEPDSSRLRQALKGGGPVAIITAGLGVGATGIAGQGVESKTAPVAGEAAELIGLAPELGPSVLLAAAVVIFGVALVVPGLFLGTHKS